MSEKYEGKVTIKEIKEFFDYEQLTGDEKSLDRWVVVPDVNRPGLELSGYIKLTEPRRVVIIGNKEQEYISEMSEELQKERFQLITDALTPCIIITRNFDCPPLLKEIAENLNFPIFKTSHPTYRVMVDLITLLDEKLAPKDSLHGVLMSVYGVGVLITGESGMGKSEIALELIKRGHVLISDDRVDIKRIHNVIKGHSPELLEGMLEIRGIGIIDVAKMFGASALLKVFNVNFIINLEKFNDKSDYMRVGNEDIQYKTILGLDIPTITLPVKEGRSMAVIVESAVTNYRLREEGFNSAKEFEKRVLEYIHVENEKRKEEN